MIISGCEKGTFTGLTVFTGVTPGMKIQTTEIFGPVVLCIMKANSLNEAIQIINNQSIWQ
ncbi:MAG: aldehyde dehydrogenase family protein [Candidatus Atribacteria bacterium]|nr:aldehyde dehydrogenase family protein [Candidatus Atribacteria bacterium]